MFFGTPDRIPLDHWIRTRIYCEHLDPKPLKTLLWDFSSILYGTKFFVIWAIWGISADLVTPSTGLQGSADSPPISLDFHCKNRR